MLSYYILSPISDHWWFSALVYSDKGFISLHWFYRRELHFICCDTSPDSNEWVKHGHVQDNADQYAQLNMVKSSMAPTKAFIMLLFSFVVRN